MEQVKELSHFEEDTVDVESLKSELKDDLPSGVVKALKKHNDILLSINAYEENITSLTPYQLSILEMYYNKAEREAWKIAGYYKSQYQYYYGKASTERGKVYIYGRDKHDYSINDSNYRSKIAEGENLEISGIYEGYYVTWKGIALSYEGARNTLKDMMRAIEKET